MQAKHFLSIGDWCGPDLERLLQRALSFKEGKEPTQLAGRTLALLFEKPSLRTRVSFEVAMAQLGGRALYLSPAEVGLGQREPARDVAQVLSRFVDGIAARTFRHETLVELAAHGTVPVINALSDVEHPCQALADLLTIWERKGGTKGVSVAYIGDANNCAVSLLYLAVHLGAHFRIASPAGYELDPQILARAAGYAQESGSGIFTSSDPREAAAGADAIYTDVWTSMGQEAETERRREAFAGYQVDEELFSHARPDAILLHPLPAHHGEEVAHGIIYSPRSAVFDQAENRLHAQKAVLAALLE